MDNGNFSSQPFVQKPLKGSGNRKKRKKDQAERLARLRELQDEALARRAEMSPVGPMREINPFNDPL
jgi:hypothetical protein